MDIFSPAKRSVLMSHIRSKDTTPEMIVRSFLHRHGFRFRLHSKKLPGHPDIVLAKYRTVIEVRGCFWHRHEGCRTATTPKTNTDFWQGKFQRNVERDIRTEKALSDLGWKVVVVWECELGTVERRRARLEKLLEEIRQSRG